MAKISLALLVLFAGVTCVGAEMQESQRVELIYIANAANLLSTYRDVDDINELRELVKKLFNSRGITSTEMLSLHAHQLPKIYFGLSRIHENYLKIFETELRIQFDNSSSNRYGYRRPKSPSQQADEKHAAEKIKEALDTLSGIQKAGWGSRHSAAIQMARMEHAIRLINPWDAIEPLHQAFDELRSQIRTALPDALAEGDTAAALKNSEKISARLKEIYQDAEKNPKNNLTSIFRLVAD